MRRRAEAGMIPDIIPLNDTSTDIPDVFAITGLLIANLDEACRCFPGVMCFGTLVLTAFLELFLLEFSDGHLGG